MWQEISNAIKKIANYWKAPGPGSIQNYCYKVFKSAHDELTRCYNKILEQSEEMPEFMATVIIYLLRKTEKYIEYPSKYRPITCLPAVYNILTSIISKKIHEPLEENELAGRRTEGMP